MCDFKQTNIFLLFLTFREVDDSFDQQIATELDALDHINVEPETNEEPSTPTTINSHHDDFKNGFSNVGLGKKTSNFSENFLNRRLKRRDDEELLQTSSNGIAKSKPNLHLKQKIAQLNLTAALYSDEGSEEIFFSGGGGGNSSRSSTSSTNNNANRTSASSCDSERKICDDTSMRRNEDHVSCEDLLEFSTKSQSKSRGQDSDEVRLMSKVLGKEMTSENCLKALNATDWDVYSAIKLAKLQNKIKNSGIFANMSNCWDALVACDGDVDKAATVLITQGSPPDCV